MKTIYVITILVGLSSVLLGLGNLIQFDNLNKLEKRIEKLEAYFEK